MLSHQEMIRLHAENYHLLESVGFKSREKYVLHLIHLLPYFQAARLAENKTVLDFGCNTGVGSKMLSEFAKKVVGADVSERAIAEAKTRYGHLPINFMVTDGIQLPFEDNEFDIIVSFQVIEHLVDYDLYINEIKRVLSPNGVVLFTTPNAILRLDPGIKPWNKFHVREFNYYELQTLLKSFFSMVRVAGIFAEEPLYEIEFNRVKRAREFARRRKDKNSDSSTPAKTKKSLKSNLSISPELENFMSKYGMKDVFYSQENLSIALDLLAVCTDNERILQTTISQLLPQNV
jgi:SAM-dependent methyltransferase